MGEKKTEDDGEKAVDVAEDEVEAEHEDVKEERERRLCCWGRMVAESVW